MKSKAACVANLCIRTMASAGAGLLLGLAAAVRRETWEYHKYDAIAAPVRPEASAYSRLMTVGSIEKRTSNPAKIKSMASIILLRMGEVDATGYMLRRKV